MELNEQEQQFYAELFQRCDLGKTTKIPVLVAGELFSSSGLPTETSLKIAEMCGATRLGYFGRSQFYIALKYIAAAQQHVPLSADVVGATNLSLPLINRAALNTQLMNHTYDPAAHNTIPESHSQPPLPPQLQIISGGTGVLPPPPTKKHVRNMSGTVSQSSTQGHQSHNNSHMVAPSHPNTIAPQPGERNQAVQNDAPVIPESNWASFPSPTKNCKPILTATTSNAAQSHDPNTAPTPIDVPPASPDWNTGGSSCGVSKKSFNIDSCSLSSADYATSEASESTDDIWVINDEQREYYVNQFRVMQSDLTATIKGPVAKEFFEKSKLSNNELSKIWKLSDVNRDGELTLQEFCTAMHLVVLKRNQVELPSTLPPSLMPYVPASSEPFAADLGGELRSRSPSPATPPVTKHQNSWPGTGTEANWTAEPQWNDQQGTAGGEQWTNSEQQWQQTGSEASVHWIGETSESGSPIQTQWTGSSHSPTSKPIQFDSAPALIVDSEIAVPVAMKMSPSSQNTLISVNEDLKEDSASAGLTRERSNTSENLMSSQSLPVRPRPTPKKAQSVGAAIVDPMMKYPPPQTVHGYQSLPGTSTAYIPPTVPPRNHWSLSSPDADLDLWSGEAAHISKDNEDPFSITRKVDDQNFADFSTKFGEPTNEIFGAISSPNNNALGDIPQTAMQPIMSPTVPAVKPPLVHQFSIRDKKEIQNSIRKQRERNEMLVRSSSELHSELQEVVEQRISLEIQLEHIRPC